MKRALKDLIKVASPEKLRKRIIEPNMTDNISSTEEYVYERNEAQDINNIEAVVMVDNEKEREREKNNEQDVIEVLNLSAYEGDDMVFEYEVDQENEALESSSDDDDDDIDENYLEIKRMGCL